MKTILITTLAAFAGATALAADYSVDPSHSRIGFSVRHLMSKVPGEFKEFEGSFNFDEKKPEASKVKFSAKAASVFTNNEKRDEHLRSGDFFDAEKTPLVTFESRKVKPAGKGKFKLEGDLTIRGIAKPVVLDVVYHGMGKDPWGGNRTGFNLTSKINRKDFGMVFNKSLDNGGVLLGDDVMLDIDVEALEKAAEKK
ncbi:MAG: YceI family protein [Oligoflexia bacterium]|nr:YceI family protein [Oligoflexia bacterium]